jgi:hypothetical protein
VSIVDAGGDLPIREAAAEFPRCPVRELNLPLTRTDIQSEAFGPNRILDTIVRNDSGRHAAARQGAST